MTTATALRAKNTNDTELPSESEGAGGKSTSGARIRLVVSGRHPLELEGMRQLFAAAPGIDVMACCETDDEARRAVLQLQPHILVLSLHPPHTSWMDILRELVRRRVSTRVVLLADSHDEKSVMEGVRLGVRGVVLKDMAPPMLLECVRHVHRGATWLEHVSIADVIDRMLKRQKTIGHLSSRLTRRELQVLQLVAQGLSNREITERLLITQGTVKIHLHNMYEKLGTNDRVKLALAAHEVGLI